jgi:hypothetical protein
MDEEDLEKYRQRRGAELAEAVRKAEARAESMTPEEEIEASKRYWEKTDAAVDRARREWGKMLDLPTLTNRGSIGPCDPQDPEIHARIQAGLDTPEIWAVSFTELKRGEMWAITIAIEHIGARHDRMTMKGRGVCNLCRTRPTARDVLAALWSAATEPNDAPHTGPPHKPLQLFIAYRLGHAFEEIQAVMATCRIACQLETEVEARASAAAHGMHYMGRNAPKLEPTACAGCGRQQTELVLKRCARCEAVWYCSRECQLNDWKSHKRSCKKGAKPICVGDVD